MVAGLVTAIDIGETALDGHVEVAFMKGLVAGTEYLVTAYVPGGVVLVLGFEILDYNIHLTDGLYKYIDSSY